MVRIGILGTGHLGKIHLKLIREIKDYELAGFYDPNDANAAQAEKEFATMKIRYSYFEGRYEYAVFLINEDRTDEAEKLLNDLVTEFPYLSAFEKRNNRSWLNKARQELRKIAAPSHIS